MWSQKNPNKNEGNQERCQWCFLRLGIRLLYLDSAKSKPPSEQEPFAREGFEGKGTMPQASSPLIPLFLLVSFSIIFFFPPLCVPLTSTRDRVQWTGKTLIFVFVRLFSFYSSFSLLVRFLPPGVRAGQRAKRRNMVLVGIGALTAHDGYVACK